MRTALLILFAAGMMAAFGAFAIWLHDSWKDSEDGAERVGKIVGGLIVFAFVVWAFNLPSWIGEYYFGVRDLTEELRTACVQVHNYTRIPETEHCKDLGKGEDTIFYVGLNDYRVPNVPFCEMNEVIVGTGPYEDGYWEDYECARK